MVGTKTRACAFAALVIGAGCSTGSSSHPASRVGAPSDEPAPPEIPDVSSLDRDRDRIDDTIDPHAGDDLVAVEAVFRAPMPPEAIAEVEASGGTIRHVLRHVGHGFTARVPRSALATLAPRLGPDLLLLKQETVVVPHLDESTRTARARAVWPAGFAGAASGFNGSAKVNIGIIDSGVDVTHPDLAGRLVGYEDFTAEGIATPKDMLGHGTHVAGIALGSGAAFGIGPGTLSVTETANAADPSDPLAADDYYAFPAHLPPSFDISGTATFEGTATTLSFLKANDGNLAFTALETTPALASPLPFTFSSTAGGPGNHFTLGLRQNALKDVKHFAIASKITSYPAVGDGFPALRGVAPLSGYYAAKIFPSVGLADTADVIAALDEIDAVHEALDIKVINCSFGAKDVALRAKIATLVSHGIVVVASAGNSGSQGETLEPGSAATALTVGATSDANLVTSYSSGRSKGIGETDTDDKPDVVAPGGSRYRSKVIAPDTNSTDSEGSSAIPDVQKDDYTSMMGTSMAAPVVAGAAALVIQGLESKGLVWDYKTGKTSLLVKTLLLATATETNLPREGNSGSPTLGRAATPKDKHEGFGIVNIDAAIEAATLVWDFADPIVGTTTGAPDDRRAWARKVHVPKGHTIKLALTAPATGDFDVHLYQSTVNGRGTPTLQAWSARAGLGLNEETTWTFLDETDLYVVVKRIEGSGPFTLTGATFTCGDGVVERGEECDDSNTKNGDCCNAGCQLEEVCATPSDAGVTEAGPEDAGEDAAVAIDAGAPDDVGAEASTPDPAPAPVPTAPPLTTAPDASVAVPASELEGGCASTSGPQRGRESFALALACALVLRRRRRIA